MTETHILELDRASYTTAPKPEGAAGNRYRDDRVRHYGRGGPCAAHHRAQLDE